MKIAIENDQDSPLYVTFENEADLNLDPNSKAEMEISEGAEIKFSSGKIETKNIKRP